MLADRGARPYGRESVFTASVAVVIKGFARLKEVLEDGPFPS